MAQINVYVMEKGEASEVIDICPKCLNPSLKRFHFWRIDMAGITILGERIACLDEKIWVSKLERYDNPHA